MKNQTRIKLTEDKKQNDILMKIQKGETLTDDEKQLIEDFIK